MKLKLLALLVFVLGTIGHAQSLPMAVAMCVNPSGLFIPVSSSGGQAYNGSLPQYVLMGGGPDGKYHPLQCDANGNLINGGSSAGVAAINQLTGNVSVIGGTSMNVGTDPSGALRLDYTGGNPTAAPVGYSPNQTLQGCGVEYVTGLQYQVGACTYTINGVTYNSPVTPETLAADPTNDRIDVLAVDNTGSVVVLIGTPSVSPEAPTIDPATQLELTFVYISAASTTPANITLAQIFDEGTEWTQTYTAHLALSTTNPYRNTHDVEATAAVLNNSVYFQNSTTIDPANYNNVVFYLRSKAAWPVGASGATAARSLSVYWANGGTQKGQQVVIRDGQFGFSSSNTTSYQQISLPLSLFGANGNPVNRLYFKISGNSGSSSIGFYLDAVSLQGGAILTPALTTTVATYSGTYSTTTAYNANSIVVSGGVGYVALVANTNVPVTNTAVWQPLGTNPGTLLNEAVTCTSTCPLTHTPKNFVSFARNGLVQRPTTDYSVSGTTVTLVVASTTGDQFSAQYYY